MAPRSPILQPMNPTTKARLIRGSLWAAHYFLLIPLGLAMIVAGAGMIFLGGVEWLRDTTATALGIERD